jgi:hypothetical protein
MLPWLVAGMQLEMKFEQQLKNPFILLIDIFRQVNRLTFPFVIIQGD